MKLILSTNFNQKKTWEKSSILVPTNEISLNVFFSVLTVMWVLLNLQIIFDIFNIFIFKKINLF